MGPSFAEFLPGRLYWLTSLFVATIVAFTLTRPATPDPVRADPYKQFKRIGKCVDGRWVYR